MHVIFVLACVMTGLYYELTSAWISVVLIVFLVLKSREQPLTFYLNSASVFSCALAGFYAISCIWAVDSGLAVWGIVKYLPVPLFGVCMMQAGSQERMALLKTIPWIGGAMTFVSYILQFVPGLKNIFSVNGRLAGFFQYPNTFACFLLIGLAVLFLSQKDRKMRLQDMLCEGLLSFGLLEAGSRTVYIMTIPVLIVVTILCRSKRHMLFMAVAVVCGMVVAGSLAIIWGNSGGIERLASVSVNASTLLGRLLYWKDAVPVILRHPFGLGYLGYYISQGSFQTGVYSVRWVHNDVLQLLFDVGWIPAVLAVIAVIKALLSKRTNAMQKVVILILLVHCMVDFDLEFVFMYFVFLLCLDWEDKKSHELKFFSACGCVAGGAMILFSLYIGVVSTLTYCGKNDMASAIYPWNTLSNIKLLVQAVDKEEMEEIADRILAQDDHITLAWDAKARVAYTNGDFGSVIAYKKQAISQARYSLEEYTDYFEMLKIGVELYQKAGDNDSAETCLREIFSIQAMLEELAENTDPLAYRIKDKPELTMPEEYGQYLAKMKRKRNNGK